MFTESHERAVERQFMMNYIDEKFMMLEMVDIRLEQMYKDAELKVLLESGTSDDLLYLYTEAEAEAEGEKEGILASIVKAFKTLWQGLCNTVNNLLGRAKGLDPNEQVNVDGKQHSFLTQCQSTLSKVTSGDWAGVKADLPRVLGVLAGGAAVGTAVAAATGMIQIKRGEGNALVNKVNSLVDQAEKFWEQKSQDHPWLQTLVNKIGEATTGAKNVGTNIVKKISNFLEKVKSTVQNFTSSLIGKITGNDGLESFEKVIKGWTYKCDPATMSITKNVSQDPNNPKWIQVKPDEYTKLGLNSLVKLMQQKAAEASRNNDQRVVQGQRTVPTQQAPAAAGAAPTPTVQQ